MFKNLSTHALGISGRQSEIIELALSYKFQGIELDEEDFRAQIQSGGLAHARRLLDSARLDIGCFQIPLNLEADESHFTEELASFGKLAGLAAQVGCRLCFAQIAPANDERPFHQNFEQYRRRLIAISEILEPLDVKLGLRLDASPEARADFNYQFIYSLDQLVMLVGMAGRKNIGVVLDLWNMHQTGHTLDEALKLGPSQILAVIVSDAPTVESNDSEPSDIDAEASGELSSDYQLLPGETGVIPAAEILAHLAELEFSGPVIPAAHPQRFHGMNRDAIVRLASEQLNQVWTEAGLTPAGKLGATGSKK